VLATDLRSGAIRRIAHSQYVDGQTDWVEGTGSYAVFTDQSHVQDDANPVTTWTLNAINVVTGKTLRLASSHGRPDYGLPAPRAGNGYAVWAGRLRSGAKEALKVERIRPRARPEVVARGGQYRDFGVARGRVAFVDATGRLTVSRLGGGGSERIRYEAHAASVRLAEGGNLIWAEPRTGDPASLWTSRVARPRLSRRIYDGDSEMQVVARDFVAFIRAAGSAGDELSVISLRGSQPLRVARNPYIPSRLAARGRLLAYATSEHLFKPRQVTTIHVVRIVRAHA
jgi:hypothetical protein